jgi:heme/copper-type cytochrome/quinol oxidase subunit 4
MLVLWKGRCSPTRSTIFNIFAIAAIGLVIGLYIFIDLSQKGSATPTVTPNATLVPIHCDEFIIDNEYVIRCTTE